MKKEEIEQLIIQALENNCLESTIKKLSDDLIQSNGAENQETVKEAILELTNRLSDTPKKIIEVLKNFLQTKIITTNYSSYYYVGGFFFNSAAQNVLETTLEKYELLEKEKKMDGDYTIRRYNQKLFTLIEEHFKSPTIENIATDYIQKKLTLDKNEWIKSLIILAQEQGCLKVVVECLSKECLNYSKNENFLKNILDIIVKLADDLNNDFPMQQAEILEIFMQTEIFTHWKNVKHDSFILIDIKTFFNAKINRKESFSKSNILELETPILTKNFLEALEELEQENENKLKYN